MRGVPPPPGPPRPRPVPPVPRGPAPRGGTGRTTPRARRAAGRGAPRGAIPRTGHHRDAPLFSFPSWHLTGESSGLGKSGADEGCPQPPSPPRRSGRVSPAVRGRLGRAAPSSFAFIPAGGWRGAPLRRAAPAPGARVRRRWDPPRVPGAVCGRRVAGAMGSAAPLRLPCWRQTGAECRAAGSGVGPTHGLRQASAVLAALSLTSSLKCSNRLEELLKMFLMGLFVYSFS